VTVLIVAGNGLVAQRAAARYRALPWPSLWHQVELDAGTQLPLVGVVAAVAVRGEPVTAAASCCAVHAEEIAVCLVQQLAAAIEAEGAALALGVAAEKAATAAGCIEIQVDLHVLVVRGCVAEVKYGAPAGQVEEAQDAGCEELAAQQLVDGGPRLVQVTVERLRGW
jgi:hypothetical protein